MALLKVLYYVRHKKDKKILGEFFVVNKDIEGLEIFEFLAEQFTVKDTEQEWSLTQTGEKNGKNYIATSKEPRSESCGKLIRKLLLKNVPVRNRYHSHPHNIPYPSGLAGIKGDIPAAKGWNKRTGCNINYKIYLPNIATYIEYGTNSKYNDFEYFRKKRNRHYR